MSFDSELECAAVIRRGRLQYIICLGQGYGIMGRMTSQHNQHNELSSAALRLPYIDDATVHRTDRINASNMTQEFLALAETSATIEYGRFIMQRSRYVDAALAGKDPVTPDKLRVYDVAPGFDYCAGALSMYKVLEAQIKQAGKTLPPISIDAQVICLESMTALMRSPIAQYPASIREKLEESGCGGEVFLDFISQAGTLTHRIGRAETALVYATEMGRYAII